MHKIKEFKPVNRHLLVVPHHKDNETESGVLLPDDFAEKKQRFIVATVLATADDCSPALKSSRYSTIGESQIIIDRSMLETIIVGPKEYNIILENYVVGILRGPNAM